MLLAAGGLALAAGVLSLVRMAPDSGVGGLGTAEAGPSPDIGGDRSPGAAATAAAVPRVSPSSTSVTGGSGPVVTTTRVTPVPADPARASASALPPAAASAAGRTAVPASTPAPRTQVTGAATPHPTAPGPVPAPTTAAPADQQDEQQDGQGPQDVPTAPGLCVPVIGLCVDALDLGAGLGAR
ncbi:hypothetical protein [Streptomyces sp. NPDC059378]|uniref:hypothetical protein n=1 Tax=Streptomyces sp. NPDC059378 TaxID=3346815 RepID=UPI0036A9A4A5